MRQRSNLGIQELRHIVALNPGPVRGILLESDRLILRSPVQLGEEPGLRTYRARPANGVGGESSIVSGSTPSLLIANESWASGRFVVFSILSPSRSSRVTIMTRPVVCAG